MKIPPLNRVAAARRGAKEPCVRGVTEIQRLQVNHVLAYILMDHASYVMQKWEPRDVHNQKPLGSGASLMRPW